MTSSRRRAGVAVLGAVALVTIYVLARGSHDEVVAPAAPVVVAPTPALPTAPRAAVVTPTAPRPPGAALSVDDVMQAKSSTEPGAVTTMIEGLSSSDAVVVAEAANGLVGRGALSALPALVEMDIAARPWAAPSLIYAMGALAAKADPEQRDEVVDRLLALMAAEKQRASNEALANLLGIYEALGQTGDARAIAPLERELVDATVMTAPKVVIVQALVALGARQSRPVLEKLGTELAPTATGTDLESALRRDLLAAIRDALERLA